jgi:hypothetical protein
MRIDTPVGTPDARDRRADRNLGPNKGSAVSLGATLLDPGRARAVGEICARQLLRQSVRARRRLSPGQGLELVARSIRTTHDRMHGDANCANALVAGLAPHVDEACLGTISEIFDGNSPHTPRGCFAQARRVSERLRAYCCMARAQSLHAPGSHGLLRG